MFFFVVTKKNPKNSLNFQGLVSALCGEENHFTIDGSAAAEAGKPEVVVSGIKDDVTVRLRPVGETLVIKKPK